MNEFADRWILPVAGHTVTRCCIDDVLTIEVSEDERATATLLIAGPFELQTADRFWHRFWRLGKRSNSIRFAPAQALSGLKVERAVAFKDGTLEMAFADGSHLRVPPNAKYEAWEFTGRHGAKAIALPGGELAIWRSAA